MKKRNTIENVRFQWYFAVSPAVEAAGSDEHRIGIITATIAAGGGAARSQTLYFVKMKN